tara:strand:+ start:115 stop:504 length:390 start_codon:yes stop_codon:yes gene_type:complete
MTNLFNKLNINGDTIVKTSTILGAGKGLFANRDFDKNEIIGEYRGKVISGDDFVNNGYILRYKKGVYIDGHPEHPEHTNMSYINTLKRQTPTQKYNVKITIDYKNSKVKMKTIRKVKKGDEFFLNYPIH